MIQTKRTPETRRRKWMIVSTGVSGADDSFETTDVDARIVGDIKRGVGAFGKAMQPAVILERIARRQQPPDAIELQALDRKQADGAMRRVRRIERAAEQADAHAVGMEGWLARRIAIASAGSPRAR